MTPTTPLDTPLHPPAPPPRHPLSSLPTRRLAAGPSPARRVAAPAVGLLLLRVSRIPGPLRGSGRRRRDPAVHASAARRRRRDG